MEDVATMKNVDGADFTTERINIAADVIGPTDLKMSATALKSLLLNLIMLVSLSQM